MAGLETWSEKSNLYGGGGVGTAPKARVGMIIKWSLLGHFHIANVLTSQTDILRMAEDNNNNEQ